MDFALKPIWQWAFWWRRQVSILVLMDFALKREEVKQEAEVENAVSILVLMDFALKPIEYYLQLQFYLVSILVLMDFALKPKRGTADPKRGHVSILVLMDFALKRRCVHPEIRRSAVFQSLF